MAGILDNLGINETIFYQFVIFIGLYFILGNIFFKPFLKLIEARRKSTSEDQKAAEQLAENAEEKFQEYQKRLHEARLHSRKEFESALSTAKQEETKIINNARAEVKEMTQRAISEVEAERRKAKKSLEEEVEKIATLVSERLLPR